MARQKTITDIFLIPRFSSRPRSIDAAAILIAGEFIMVLSPGCFDSEIYDQCYLEGGKAVFSNRSIPRATVIPVLAYPDVNQAAAWLCDAFGFSVRLRIGNHRVQLNVGDAAVIVRELRPGEFNVPLGTGHSVTIRIEDADAHCERAKASGARITQEPVTHPFCERQYNAEDFAGHCWTFFAIRFRC